MIVVLRTAVVDEPGRPEGEKVVREVIDQVDCAKDTENCNASM